MAEKFDGLIDEPGPYATLQTWERFLKRLLEIDPADEFKAIRTELIRQARRVIAEKKKTSAKIAPTITTAK